MSTVLATAGINRDALRRILVGLIADEQARRIAAGALLPERALDHQVRDGDVAATEALTVDEASLGFDSLARLELILRVTQMFGLQATGVDDYLLLHRSVGDWCDLVEKHIELAQQDFQITFATSGSTGPAKQISHAIAPLQEEVAALTDGPIPEPPARVLSLVPPFHIYGFLFSCLWPVWTGAPVRDLHRRPPTAVVKAAQPGDVVIATPFQWRHIVRAGARFGPGVTGVTSAGPADAEAWKARTDIGLTRLVEIYGATETAGLGYRDSPDAPFAVLPHLEERDGLICRRGGAVLTVQDRLHWRGPRTFDVLGRLDDVVQVAGVNVSPAQVVAVLRSVEGVTDAAVRAGPDRLRAFVAAPADQIASRAFQVRLRDAIDTRLAAPARPASLTFGPSLPRTSMGKPADWT